MNNTLSKLKVTEPKAPTADELTKALNRKNALHGFTKAANDTDKLKKTILKASTTKQAELKLSSSPEPPRE